MSLKAPFPWFGGKSRAASLVWERFGDVPNYVEPFAGAASVLLRKSRSYAEIINDLDGEVVNVFRVLRDPATAAALARALTLTPFARAEFVAAYTPAADPIEQARRTVARAFMGFGSPSVSGHKTGFRANGQRSSTTPAHDWVNWPDQVAAYVDRLRGVVIENRDAVEVIRQQDSPSTLFYVDPPYPSGTRNPGNGYDKKGYRHEMTDDDHRRLAEVLYGVRGMVVLSGYPCDLYDRELYPDWRRLTCDALADGARPRTEVLWLSPRASSMAVLPLFAEVPA